MMLQGIAADYRLLLLLVKRPGRARAYRLPLTLALVVC
jgi:hypothetical protein